MTNEQEKTLRDIKLKGVVLRTDHPAGGALLWVETTRYDYLVNPNGEIRKIYQHGGREEVPIT